MSSYEKKERALTTCAHCHSNVMHTKLKHNYMVCPNCGYHFTITARQRIKYLVDAFSFKELFTDIEPYTNDFPEYTNKLHRAYAISGELEAVICGECRINGIKSTIFVMEPSFMMGSMGKIVGEKITLCFEYATKKHLPVIGVCSSGGVRVQEGLISLMQMAKITNALHRHDQQGNLFLSLITNPTLGGVMASFAMCGDYILAEPNAIAGFAGRKIMQTIEANDIDPDCQNVETLLKNGYVDQIVTRNKQRYIISSILGFHKNYENGG